MFEAKLLSDWLESVFKYYELAIEDLPPVLQKHWRGRIGAAKDVEMLQQEQAQLEAERQVWRAERLPLLGKWGQACKQAGYGRPLVLELDGEELETFLMILNDRRLTLSVEYNVDERLMGSHPQNVTEAMVRQAIWEIRILEGFIYVSLAAINLLTHPGHAEEDL